MPNQTGKYDTAEARWAGVGPYYAMFPTRFADKVIEKYTQEGDTIIDPFAGRGTSIFSAATKGRHALGIEINPVGWVYAATKLEPTEQWRAEKRVEEIGRIAGRFRKSAEAMPHFFHFCFSMDVLAFLLAARHHLNWRQSIIDRTVMAILLIDLHGKRQLAFSNQMRQTKSMSPDYAIRWWKKNKLRPPKRDAVDFTQKKMNWRYARGLPETSESRVYLGDNTHKLVGLRTISKRLAPKGASLLFTSPPYFGVTNYHYDQWLRIWLLGGAAQPRSLGTKYSGRFQNPENYRRLLHKAFSNCHDLLSKDAVIYVRTDRRKITSKVTREILGQVFSKHEIHRRCRPLKGKSQTQLFGIDVPAVGEIDFILTSGMKTGHH
jgi:DNA modification methylase